MAVASPHPHPDQLAAFDLGRLPPDQWTLIERHVAACESCCRRLEGLPDDSLAALVRASASAWGDETSAPLGDPTNWNGSEQRTDAEVPAELVDHPRYRILTLLGAGGMGVVFRAEHRLMERTVALKVINRRLVDRPDTIQRFRQEVKAAARLDHPNIVAAYDAEQAGDLHFLVMEFVAGSSLDRFVAKSGPLPVARACYLVQQAALGLQHACEKGMVHRDIKPQNLMLTPEGRVKVLDFGLARFASENDGSARLTAAGVVVGTPDYIAPEQALDPRVADVRADIYSLGCTLYYLLTGQPPFAEGTVLEKLIRHREATPRPLAEFRSDVPAEVAALVDRMMAKSPAERFQMPDEVARRLAPFTQNLSPTPHDPPPARSAFDLAPPRTARRRRFLWYGMAAASLLAATIALAMLTWPRDRQPTRLAETKRPTIQAVPIKPLPKPTTATAQPTPRSPRERAVDWLARHNRFPPGATFLSETTAQIDQELGKDNNLLLGLGADIVSSRRLTYLCIREGEFYVFEMTAEQGKALKHGGKEVSFQNFTKEKQTRVSPPLFELSAPRVEGGDRLVGEKPAKASVHFRRLIPDALADGLRVTCLYNGNRTAFSATFKSPPTAHGTLHFFLKPLDPDRVGFVGPVILFFELYRQKGDARTIVSSAVPLLVNVVSPE